MNNKQRAALRSNHVSLVQDLEPRGGVLDSLYEDGVLTENDCELITNASTRKERCQLLLHLIPTRGPGAYGSFRKALQSSNYEFLSETLKEDLCQQNCKTSGTCTANCKFDGCVDSTLKKIENEMLDTPTNPKWCSSCTEFIKTVYSETGADSPKVKGMIQEAGCLILDNVEPNDVIDHLFQDEIIGTDSVDMIKSGVTRRKRCELLVQFLIANPHTNTTGSMTSALNKKYKYIANKLQGRDENHLEDNDDTNSTNCKGLYSKQPHTISDNTHSEHAKELSPDVHECKETDVKFLVGVQDIDGQLLEGRVDINEVDGCYVRKDPHQSVARENQDKTCRYLTKADNEKIIKKSVRGNVDNTTESLGFREDQIVNPSKVMATIPSQASHKGHRLTVAFNYLSTLINQGEFVKYENISSKLQRVSPRNYDLLCIIGYLNASRDLFRADFDAAKRNIQSTMELVPKTSNPRYFILELFTAKTRMYITQKKLEKLQKTLDEAMMILETDPEGCTGRAAGWLYINDARNKTAQLSCLNLSKQKALKSYEHLFARAKASFQRSMNNFKLDGGKDGPFGFGYALCRLAILLLRCGDNGMTMASLKPPEDDVYTAGQYLQHLEDSDIPIPKILEMHFCLAKCDYQFRRNNYVRSFQHAQTAYDIATEMNMLEFTEHAHNRLKYLRSAFPVNRGCHDINEEDLQEILFGQSTESEDTALSE